MFFSKIRHANKDSIAIFMLVKLGSRQTTSTQMKVI